MKQGIDRLVFAAQDSPLTFSAAVEKLNAVRSVRPPQDGFHTRTPQREN
jgi:hypothetical protein